MLAAINRRHSDRRAFGPVPNNRIPARYPRRVDGVHDVRTTFLSAEAKETLATASRLSANVRKYDASYQAEIRWWAGHSFRSGGIPPEALTDRTESSRVRVGREFPEPHRIGRTGTAATDESTVVLLGTASDERVNWLQCGRVMSAFLLAATADGLATCPLTHMTEQAGSRALVESLAPGRGVPQVLIRIGAPMVGSPLAPTPRRAVSSVLSVATGSTARGTRKTLPL